MKGRRIIEISKQSGNNKVIQDAVDELYHSGGGTVKIGPGLFILYDSIHLKSGVNIIGSGNQTVFKKCASVRSELSADLGYGHYDVSVKKPGLFKKGMGIYISDDSGKGFYATVATITWKYGDRLGISKMLNHDYARVRNAVVSSVFPVISGHYVKDSSVENILIDGNRDKNGFIDGCRGGGVFLLQCHNMKLRNITVRNYNGDGISFQQCTYLKIEDCEIVDNFGSGLHPGSGSVCVVMKNCKIHRNGKDGVFYCLRVSHTLLEGCSICQNGNDGVSIGARDTDHIIKENYISENARHGIYFRIADEPMGGHRNLVDSNRIVANCIKHGEAEIFIEDINNNQWFRKNFIDGGKKLNFGIIVGDKCKGIYVSPDNRFINVKGKAKYRSGKGINFREFFGKIGSGPDFVTSKSFRHLGIE